MVLRIVIFYVLTWFFIILLGGIQQQTGLLPAEIGLPQWGPAIAALLMLFIFRKDGFILTFVSKNTGWQRYLQAAIIPAGAALLVWLLSSLLQIQPQTASATQASLWLAAIWAPFGALGEEIGWRGYLHKKLDPQMRGLVSSILVGLLWMPIHIHFLNQGPLFIFLLVLLIISYSVVVYALVQETGFSILLAAIFHLTINLTNMLYLDLFYETQFMLINALVWVLIAAGFVVAKRQLFFERRK